MVEQKSKLKYNFQDRWFHQWFTWKKNLLHEKYIDYAWVLLNLGIDSGNILDVGCGGSFYPLLLSILGFNVTAIDNHPMNYKLPHYTFIQSDAATVELDEKFDRIICMSTLEHVGLQERQGKDYDFTTIKHLRQFLKSDGQWLITVPFGKYTHMRNWRIYDQNRLNELFPNIVKQEYFTREGAEPFFKKIGLAEAKTKIHRRGQPHSASTCLVANK